MNNYSSKLDSVDSNDENNWVASNDENNGVVSNEENNGVVSNDENNGVASIDETNNINEVGVEDKNRKSENITINDEKIAITEKK